MQRKTNSIEETLSDFDFWEVPVKVLLSCTKEYFDEALVEFLNIEEGIQGQDVLTFTCPRCADTHKSLMFG